MNDQGTVTKATLEQALGAAQAEMQAVYKDATNQHHRYKYASAENMIAQCRQALHNVGLVLHVMSHHLEEKGGVTIARCLAILAHPASQECKDLVFECPVYVDKGRPIDKAYFGALTGSLSYMLRGLLLVVRDDETSIDGRNDTAYVPSAKPVEPPKREPSPQDAPGAMKEVDRVVRNLRGETGVIGWSFEEAKKALEACTKREDLLEVADRISKEITDPKVQMQLADVFFQCEQAVK